MFRRYLYAGAAVMAMAPVSGHANLPGELPELPVFEALDELGVSVVQEFEIEGELRAFAGMVSGQPIAIYVDSDGSAIVGTRMGSDGARLDELVLQEVVSAPMAEQEWGQLALSDWVLDGDENAPRIAYVFSDPNCPFCNRFWEDSRPWVDAGRVQLRHIMVGIIQEDSPGKAAAILEADDRSAALQENESNFAQGGIEPAETLSTRVRETLDSHQSLMLSQGFRGTPGIVVRGGNGEIQKYSGMPRSDELSEVLGPR